MTNMCHAAKNRIHIIMYVKTEDIIMANSCRIMEAPVTIKKKLKLVAITGATLLHLHIVMLIIYGCPGFQTPYKIIPATISAGNATIY